MDHLKIQESALLEYRNWEQTDGVLVTDHLDSFLEEENAKSIHEYLTHSVEEEKSHRKRNQMY